MKKSSSKMRSAQLTSDSKHTESNFANAPIKKKVGFFSAMLVVIGSCIGSGIFFKARSVLVGSQYSIVLAMVCWLFVAFATLCMALALIEIVSARNDNLSLIGWCKTFNNRYIYKFSKNYMFYLYTPIKGFFLPLYMIMSFQDGVAALYIQNGSVYPGFGTNADWAIAMLITAVVITYFTITCGFSIKWGNAQNWMITGVKFLPLILAGIVGFVIFGMNGGKLLSNSDFDFGFSQYTPSGTDLYTFKLLPGLGFFIAATGILYAYDGFYGAAGIKTEMKDPKKAPSVILVGLIVVTVIYLVIALSMSLGSTAGNPQGLVQFFAQHNIIPVFAVFQILIGVGIMGVCNGYYMFAPRFVEDLVRDGELPFSKTGAKYLAKGSRFVGVIYCLAITIPTIILFSVIGSFYINTTDSGYGVLFASMSQLPENLASSFGGIQVNGNIYYTYGTGMGKLYTFTDMVSNWSALFVFMFLTFALFGGLQNRKTHRVEVNEFKYFKPAAIISGVCIAIPVILTIVEPFVNLIFLAWIPTSTSGYVESYLVPRIMALVMLFFYIAFTILPTIIEDSKAKKTYGSIEAYEEKKLEQINIILGEPLGTTSNDLAV